MMHAEFQPLLKNVKCAGVAPSPFTPTHLSEFLISSH